MLEEFATVAHAYWTQFLFVLPRLLVAAALLAAVWLASGRLRSYLTRKLAAHSADPLLTNFLTQVGRWLLVLGGLLLALQIIGLSGVVGGLLGGLGLSAFLVGFAFKDIAENFLAGVILAFNRPFNVDDSIQVKELLGRVVELNLRTTHQNLRRQGYLRAQRAGAQGARHQFHPRRLHSAGFYHRYRLRC